MTMNEVYIYILHLIHIKKIILIKKIVCIVLNIKKNSNFYLLSSSYHGFVTIVLGALICYWDNLTFASPIVGLA